MNSHILAIRALASTLARKILLPIIIIAAIVFALVILLLLWAMSEVGAWLILIIIPIGFIGVIIGLALGILYKTVQSISPKMNKDQKKTTNEFIGKLEEYAELKNTPKVLIVWRIIFSALKRTPRKYIDSIVNDSAKLKRSYTDLVSSFSNDTSRSSRKRKVVDNLADK